GRRAADRRGGTARRPGLAAPGAPAAPQRLEGRRRGRPDRTGGVAGTGPQWTFVRRNHAQPQRGQRMKRLRTTLVAVAAVTSLLLSACGGDSDDGDTSSGGNSPGQRSDWDAGAGPEWDTLLEAARAEGRVVVGGPAFLAEPMVEAFRRDTGIELEWLGATGSELSARLQQEVTAGNVTMDLKLGGPQELFVDYKSLLEPLAPQLILPTVTDESKWRGGELPWSDPDETYMLRTAAYVFGWVVVNRDILDPATIRT